MEGRTKKEGRREGRNKRKNGSSSDEAMNGCQQWRTGGMSVVVVDEEEQRTGDSSVEAAAQ